MKKSYSKKSKEDKELEGMGTTLEVCLIYNNTSPEQLKEFASYMGKFYNYSLRNTILIKRQFKGALAVGSYAFWKEKGYTVNKGEKGIKILVPTRLSDYFINLKGEEVKINKANLDEKALIEQGKIEVKKGKLVFNQGYVFDISQTNAKGEDLPKIFPNKWLDGEVKNYDLMYSAMRNIANNIGVKIIEPKSELGVAKGVSYTLTKEVALNPRNTQLQNVKTLLHELTHAKLHTIEKRNNYSINEREFQAELVAYTVCNYFGLDTAEYSFRYIKQWTKNTELNNKEKLINEVRETVKEYIEVIEKTLINENIVEKEIRDEKLKKFLGRDRVVINEITRDKMENIINRNNSTIFLENEQELTIKNEVVAMKGRNNKYVDVYWGTEYKLENLIYIDDNKNLYKIKKIENDKSQVFNKLEELKIGEVRILMSESPAFKENQILHFIKANEILEYQEKRIERLKREYNKENKYYPYEKVKGEVKISDKEILKFRFDIGDGEFRNLIHYLEKHFPTKFRESEFLYEQLIDENRKLLRLSEIKIKNTREVDENNYFKEPFIAINMAEGNKFKKDAVIDFREANKIFKKEEENVKKLKEEYSEKGEYYPNFKVRFDLHISPNWSIDLRYDIGDGFAKDLIDFCNKELRNSKFLENINALKASEIEKDKLDMIDENKEKEIRKKIREHEEWINTNGLKGKQLNLENENLSGMKILNADLRNSNLKNADITECIIFADLRGADLRGAKINNTKWTGSQIGKITIEANKLNLINYQLEQEGCKHIEAMKTLKTNKKEKELER